jgi:hypothetical protein
MFIQTSINILLLSLVSAHCGQLVAPDKIKATNGDKIKVGKYNFKSIGQSCAAFGLPIGDFAAPKDYVGLNEEKSYFKMLNDGLTVKTLFEQVVANENVVAHYANPEYGNFTADTCGYFDPNFEVEIAEDTNPQTSTTGNNHGGPAEVWMDGVMTHHISNLMYQQPEVLSRNVYNCNQESCLYKWYWIAFRADQPVPTFQMWVNCARVKGNGKAPMPVEPTQKWLVDPRGSGKDLYKRPNDVKLPICDNPSEKPGAGYSYGTAPVLSANTTATVQSVPAVTTNPSQSPSAPTLGTAPTGNQGYSSVFSPQESSPALSSAPIPVATTSPYSSPVKRPTSPCRGQIRKRSIHAGRK